MKIGILGAGSIGGTVGTLWAQAGHEVRFGTRHPGEVKGLVERLGARASAGTPEDAARFGDAVLLAVPVAAVPALGRAIANLVAGKVVLDASNAYRNRDGALADAAMGHPQGSSGWVASTLVRSPRPSGWCAMRDSGQSSSARWARASSSNPTRRSMGVECGRPM